MLAPTQLLSASRQNLWRLTWIRLLVLAAQAGTLGFTYLSGVVSLAWLQLVVLLALSLSMCVLTGLRLRGSWPVTELEFAAHLAMDLFIHSGLLYYVGGSTNPFVAYYLVPLTIAASHFTLAVLDCFERLGIEWLHGVTDLVSTLASAW